MGAWWMFTILNSYMYALFSYSFSFDPSLWWPLLLNMVAIKGHTRLPTVLALILLYGGRCFSVWQPSKVTHGFPHHIIMLPTHDSESIITA